MNVKTVRQIDEHLAGAAWDLYWEAFHELNANAVQRHLMYRDEFDDVMRDRRILKYLCFDNSVDSSPGSGDQLVGLSTYTNALDAWPLIAPAYFHRRWPDLFTARRIWYCGFVAIAPAAQRGGAFPAMVEAMWRQADETGGMIVLDMCAANEERGLARATELMLRRHAGAVDATRLDAQSFWSYTFPGGVGE